MMPYPSNYRAVVSTAGTEPVAAPPLISVAPCCVARGESILMRARDPAGKWSAAIFRSDETAPITKLYDIVEAWRGAARPATRGLFPGDYEAVLLGPAVEPEARAAFTVVASDAAPSLFAASARIAVGEPLVLSWRNTPGAARDWVGVYGVRETNLDAYRTFLHTQGNVNGEAMIDTAGLPPGDYEAWLLFDEGYEVLAVTNFTIAGRGIPTRASH